MKTEQDAYMALAQHYASTFVEIMDRLVIISTQNPKAFPAACTKAHEFTAEIIRDLKKFPKRSWETVCIFDGFLLRWKEEGATALTLKELEKHRDAWIFNAAMLGKN